jgi:glycosyltransferase involved in cell wall biosynthesis
MKVVVAHPSLNRGGGAEKVCLATIRTLIRNGYRVKLVTIDRTDWAFLDESFGVLDRPSEEVYVMERMPIRGRSSQGVFTFLFFLGELVFQQIKNEDAVVVNTYGDLIDSVADVSYINALPVRVYYKYPDYGFSSSAMWRFIVQAYSFCLNVVDKLFRSNVLVVNSTFMQGIVSEHFKRDSMVVFPPVDLEKFSSVTDGNRRNMVVTVSRLRAGKNLEFIPRIAKLVKKGEFTILGLADEASQDAVVELKKAIKVLGVEDRVRLLVNQPFRKLVDVLASAKVFLHTQPMEAFGIAVVEAMAAGCVPVVPKEGGPWFDILDQRQGFFGFSYGSVGEAAGLVERLFVDEDLRGAVSVRARGRALVFDSSVFEREILRVVKRVCSVKFG